MRNLEASAFVFGTDLLDEGYDVHAVYVDLGQPCEDREAILAKARSCGAKTSRLIDAREVNGETSVPFFSRDHGCEIDYPISDLQQLSHC